MNEVDSKLYHQIGDDYRELAHTIVNSETTPKEKLELLIRQQTKIIENEERFSLEELKRLHILGMMCEGLYRKSLESSWADDV